MAAIIISRGCYHGGSDVARRVAATLGYECISREVLLEASQMFDIPELKLMHAIRDAPSLLERFGRDRRNFITYIRTILLRRLQEDNVVYHGFAGHFFVQGIPGILKVRVFAGIEERVKEEMKREGTGAEQARETILSDDEERRRWALSLYGMDPADPSLYDMLLQIGHQTVDDAARMIAAAAVLPAFRMNADSKKLLNDRVLANQVEALLAQDYPGIRVMARDGEAVVSIRPGLRLKHLLSRNRVVANVSSVAIELGGADKVRVSFTG